MQLMEMLYEPPSLKYPNPITARGEAQTTNMFSSVTLLTLLIGLFGFAKL